MRPGLEWEPAPQVRAATVGYVAAAAPLLMLPVLGGGDTLDDATVSFLLAQALLERQELQEMEDAAKSREEVRLKKERKMARIVRQVAAGSPVAPDDLAAWQRWNTPDPEEEEEKDEEVTEEVLAQLLHMMTRRFLPHCCTWKPGHFSSSPLDLAVSCSVSATPEEHKKIGLSGRRLQGRCLVQQWIHAHASVYGVMEFTRFST